MDWITHSAALLAKFKKPIKVLSLGCGFGVIERVLRRSDYCQLIHGVDVAEGAIEGARKAAHDEGMSFLRDSALARVRAGITTMKEINKVTFIE